MSTFKNHLQLRKKNLIFFLKEQKHVNGHCSAGAVLRVGRAFAALHRPDSSESFLMHFGHLLLVWVVTTGGMLPS